MTKKWWSKIEKQKMLASLPADFPLEFLLPKEAQNHQLGSLDSTRWRSCGRFCLGRQFEWYLGIKVLGIWVDLKPHFYDSQFGNAFRKILRHQHERSGKCQKRVTWLEKSSSIVGHSGAACWEQKEKLQNYYRTARWNDEALKNDISFQK